MGRVLVFLYDTMADFEMTLAAYFVARGAQREVVPISYDGGPRTALSSLVYQATLTVQQALALDDVDGLIIPGGMSGDLRPELVTLIKRLDGEGRLLAAICAGPHFLARVGVLDGRRYTTSLKEWTDEDRRKYGGDDPFPRATFTGATVERDGHVITAEGTAFVEFAVAILEHFGYVSTPAERAELLATYRGIRV